MITLLLIIFAILLGIIFVVMLQGLFYWAIGSFVCWAFAIPYVFQFKHGLAVACLVSVIVGLIKNIKGENN